MVPFNLILNLRVDWNSPGLIDRIMLLLLIRVGRIRNTGTHALLANAKKLTQEPSITRAEALSSLGPFIVLGYFCIHLGA